MRCGRCKASGVDVAHVRSCYSSASPPATTVVDPPVVRAVPRPPTIGAVDAGAEIDDDLEDPVVDDPWAEDQRSAAALGLDITGMDADGRSAWMRAVEEEDGVEGLYFSMPSSYDLMEDE